MNQINIFATFYWTWVASEVLLQISTRTGRNSGQLRDRGSLLVLLSVIFCSIWLGFSYGATHPHTLFGGAPWVRSLALTVLILGMVLRWTAILTLGRSFSVNVAIHSTQTVQKNGLYRWMRHPSYSGMVLIFLAIGLWTRNWISLAILIVPPVAALLFRIHVEEAALHEAFGADYADYSRATKRLIPGIY